MYPSSNNNGCKPPWASFSGNYYNDTNFSIPHQENYYTPSPNYIPIEDEAVFCEFFQQQFFSNDHNYLTHEMTTNAESTMEEYSNNSVQVATNDPYDFDTHVKPENSTPRRKRSSKGDRHSKIETARGPRDRRMRLSLDVAKKLFGLQDLLGFDKASKTVDWLITQSKTAILELLPDPRCSFMGVSNSASSTSECEVLSGTIDQSSVKTGDDQANTKNKTKSSSESTKKQKEKIIRAKKSADFQHPIAKATREKARARARERTIEKRNYKLCGGQDSNFRPCLDQAMDQDVNPLGSWNPFEESQRQPDHINSCFEFKQGFVADNSTMIMTANWSPSYVLNYHHSAGLPHPHQFNDFQIIGKASEGNNN